MHIWYNELTIDVIKEHTLQGPQYGVGLGSHRRWYMCQNCGFDIETTSIITADYATAYMYIWSFTYNDLTILGSYWDEFISLLNDLKEYFELDEDHRLLVFIANMSFEFQFMRKWLNVSDSFFIEERIPLYVIHDNAIEFRDALQITGGSLAYLAKNYTKTQKMVGDLDYTIKRNHQDAKKLTPEELQYVINDTKILAEYMEYYWKTFIPLGYLPLTKTGILRKEVTKTARTACRKQKKRLPNIMTALHPQEKLYDLMMKYLFRGGYVHGANATVGLVLENLSGVDITSSYPNEMNVKDNYPMSKFYRDYDTSIEHYEELNKNYATMAVIRFHDLDATMGHSLESNNKLIKKYNTHLDNGRVLDCLDGYIEVFITELDYDLYKKFYTWSKMEVLHLWKAKRGRLPRYLIDTINKYYEAKSRLKKEGKKKTTDYALSKEMVNSGYGLTVTRMRKNKILYNTDLDTYEIDTNFVFQKEVEKLALLPQWGIWVTANARHTLMDMVYNLEVEGRKFGYDLICHYEDTDSIKIEHYNDVKHIIDEYNKKQDERIKYICSEFGYNYEYMKGLGSFDLELPYIKKFKHNGAKRYLLKYYDFETKEYRTESTISGLPKKSLLEYCRNNHLSVWKTFTDGMNIPIKETGKLASIYNDEPHQDVVNGELMEEKSSICLVPIEFTMSIDKDYMKYIEEAERRIIEGSI